MGKVIWICGLSGAGKTTLAQALIKMLPESPILLDGDEMRVALELLRQGYDKDNRRRFALTYSRWAKLLADQGQTVVVATISLFREVFEWNRANLPGYVEVFLDVPVEVLRTRDFKGVYAEREGGKPRNISGVDVPMQTPQSPDILIKYRAGDRVEEYVQMILRHLSAMETKKDHTS